MQTATTLDRAPLVLDADAYASWEEVGAGSASGGGISDNSGGSWSASLAFAPDGTPYVAWSDDSSGDSEIYVRQWDGSSWVEVGAGSASGGGISDNSGNSLSPSLAIAPDGTPYVAWHDNSYGGYQVYVRRWNGSFWAYVGAGSVSGGVIGEFATPLSLTIAPDGTPYVAWQHETPGSKEIYVRQWDGSAWVEVGAGSASGGGISDDGDGSLEPSLAIASDGTPYVAWYNYSGWDDSEIYVRRWDGSTWAEVGAGSASGGGISDDSGDSMRPSLAIAPGGTPYITWQNNNGDGEIYVRRWDGSTWAEVGAGSASGGGISDDSDDSAYPSVAIAPDSTPYVAWWYRNSSGDEDIYVRRWDGSTWAEVGDGSASGGGISDNSGRSLGASAAIAPDGTPYVAWNDISSGDWEIYIRRRASIVSARLDPGALAVGGEEHARTSKIYVWVADSDRLGDIASVMVDLSSIGGTMYELRGDRCLQPEEGLYCGTIHTIGDVPTGNVALPITVTDEAGLQESYTLQVKVVMLMYDILQALAYDRDSILGQEVWIAAVPAVSFDPGVITDGLEIVEAIYLLMKPSLIGLTEALIINLFTGWTHAQLFLGTHYYEYINVLLPSWKVSWPGADFLPLGMPYYLRVRVSHSDLGGFDYLEVLQAEEDIPSPAHPYYTLPEGYTYYHYYDVATSVPNGTKACTIGIVSERYRLESDWPSHAFFRLQLQVEGRPLVARIPADQPAPDLGDLALVCGTKQEESDPVYESDEWGELYDNLDTTQGEGTITLLRGIFGSMIYNHEYLADPALAAAIACPADLHLYDAQGRHTGPVYDGEGNVVGIDREIPETTYIYGAGDSREVAVISNPVASPYQIEVRGTATGSYTQTITIRNRQGSQTYYSSDEAVPTALGQIDSVVVDEIPAAPTGLTVVGAGDAVNLDWEDNAEADLAGYNVYRGIGSAGPYGKINDELLSTSAFVDPTGGTGLYYYYVTAEDTDHNESGHLAPVVDGCFIYLPLVLKDL